MNISALQPGAVASPAVGATGQKASGLISSDFETFLKMLTTQMQNQDPLDPMKSEDFAVQLATFSGVEQQVRTNDLISAMTAQLNQMGMAQMSGWVGMEARAPVAGYFDGAPITLSLDPLPAADRTELVVRNADGVEVQRLKIDAPGQNVEWAGVADDGTALPTGLYDFELQGTTNGDLVANAPVEVYTEIVEARSMDGQIVLVTRGGATVPASLISALRDPNSSPAAM